MTLIKTVCRTEQEFLERFLAALPQGGLFIPTRRTLEVGELVTVSIRIGARAEAILMRAQVIWCRRGEKTVREARPMRGEGTVNVRWGVAVEFLASEAEGLGHLLAVAKGDGSATFTRRHKRLPTNLPVDWRSRGSAAEISGVLSDIGLGGTFLRTDGGMAVGTEIVLWVAPPGTETAMPLSARVAWVSPGYGFGLSWKARDPGGLRRIKELVRRTAQLNETSGNELAGGARRAASPSDSNPGFVFAFP
ncbi:MAG TPA: PilZ domain-containing protein [Polyangia bacterium]|jgi:Tfp pilus assembly protein PilZ